MEYKITEGKSYKHIETKVILDKMTLFNSTPHPLWRVDQENL